MHVHAVTDCVKIARVNVTPWPRRKGYRPRHFPDDDRLAGCAMPAVDGTVTFYWRSAYSGGRDSRFTPARRATTARGFKNRDSLLKCCHRKVDGRYSNCGSIGHKPNFQRDGGMKNRLASVT